MNDKFQINSLPTFEEIEQGLSRGMKKAEPSYLNPERFMLYESVIDRDYSYMKKNCPSIVGQISEWMEDECDRLEYEGSFLYDQYPDKTTIQKIADRIEKKLPPDTAISPKDLIMALLCDEILYRRCRYYRKKKMFEHD